ncbi:DUF6301 family protein [Streptomyces sp. NPDC051018]|uniref:DUF6301 family protein n=1 Tax=Streptomyces sp. NPDC051018 TaxID=3365639 RepID=UPI0037A0B591
MIDSTRLSDDQIGDLVRAFAVIDLGDWGRPDIERVLAEHGWSLDREREKVLCFSTGLPTGSGYADTDTGYSPALSVTLADGVGHAEAVEVFHTARRYAEELLGPAPMRGGFGPWLRWRRDGATPRLRFSRASREPVTASVRLELLATDPYEYREASAVDHLGEPPYSWCRIVHTDEMEGVLIPGDTIAQSWEDVERGMAGTLEDLAEDLPVLGEQPLTLLIEDWSDDSREPTDKPTCYVRFTDGVLTVECPASPTPELVPVLTELGWTEPSADWAAVAAGEWDWTSDPEGNPSFSREWPTTSPAAPADAARLVTGALRATGATLPGLSYWVGRNGESLGVNLPALGI